MEAYIVFWRSGTDSMELDCPAKRKRDQWEKWQLKQGFAKKSRIGDWSQRGTWEAGGKVEGEGEEEKEERENG